MCTHVHTYVHVIYMYIFTRIYVHTCVGMYIFTYVSLVLLCVCVGFVNFMVSSHSTKPCMRTA